VALVQRWIVKHLVASSIRIAAGGRRRRVEDDGAAAFDQAMEMIERHYLLRSLLGMCLCIVDSALCQRAQFNCSLSLSFASLKATKFGLAVWF
jgi:hypothetical protein